MEFRIHRLINKDAWGVWVFEYDAQGNRIPIKITIERGGRIEPHSIMDPSFEIPREGIRNVTRGLIDGLAEAGFLATTGPQELEMKATRAHLEDMRALVFQRQPKEPSR